MRLTFYARDFPSQRPTLSCRRARAAHYRVRMPRGNTQKNKRPWQWTPSTPETGKYTIEFQIETVYKA
jgi:hypothetical protein